MRPIESNSEYEIQLADDIAEFYDDPEGFVMYAFPWGEKDSPLEDYKAPDEWQLAQLQRVRAAILADPLGYTIRESVASGHGVGKSALVAMIILWLMSTRPHLNGVITANTTIQLSTKTWRELALWHKRAINGHWFKWTATKFFHQKHPETWFVAAVPNTEHNSEAFAGLHGEFVVVIMDEGSAIPDKICEVAEGAMTTPRAMWFMYGNPTKNTGYFRETFHSDSHRWTHTQIDSRTCMMTNKHEIREQIRAYGEDSDFIRVRVKGQFPRAGNMQFISSEIADAAMKYEAPYETYYNMPVVMGVDVARYGEDKTVIALRAGRKLLELRKYRELSTMAVAQKCAEAIREFKPAVVFVDEVGIGAGVVDRLRMLNYDVIGVNAGTKASDEDTYFNKRAEMWDRMRKWLDGADIPSDAELRASLIGIEYGFSATRGTGEVMMLEKKRDMKKRGLKSPDEGDALAHTFAEHLGDYTARSFEPIDESFEPAEAAA